MNQGVQQPYDAEIITGVERKDIRAIIYPNPTFGQIQLQFNSDLYSNCRAELIDGSGKIIVAQKLLSSFDTISLEMANSGIFNTTVFQDDWLLKSSRILKSN